jgi:hypothetical protein
MVFPATTDASICDTDAIMDRMDGVTAAIERWNTFAPMLPLTLSLELLWIALPLALVAFLFLAAFSCGRVATRLASAVARPPVARRAAWPPLPRRRATRRAEARPHGPRGPTRARGAALA